MEVLSYRKYFVGIMYRKYIKRPLDFIVALISLVLLLPLFILLALLIKLESAGPVFFTQKRGGKNGRYFTLFKFRSMKVDSDAEKAGFEPGTSSRITTIGTFLRKTKVDEFPQLINVLKGDMAIVGPRPEVKKYIDAHPHRWEKILLERPGITDPASIKFRNEEEILADATDPEREYIEKIMPEKMAAYEEYVENISLFGDIKIILQTIFAVLRG